MINRNPGVSILGAERQTGFSKSTVRRPLRQYLEFCPYVTRTGIKVSLTIEQTSGQCGQNCFPKLNVDPAFLKNFSDFDK